MSAGRTLISVIRAALSLIGFGFTIFLVFKRLNEAPVVKGSGTTATLASARVLGPGDVRGWNRFIVFMLDLSANASC